MTASASPRHLPTADEALLLQAACLAGEPAASAWRQWQKRNRLADCTKASHDLLPAVFRNLESAHCFDQHTLTILRGTYRKTSIQNNMQAAAMRLALGLLEERGIDSMLLKGAALTAAVYKDAGIRPMADVDVLVPLQRAAEAYGVLLGHGWTPEISPGGDMNHVLRVVRSLDLINSDGTRLDLHWHVLADACDPGDDDDFWAASQAVRSGELTARTLCPSDLLLHAIVHGSKWSSTRSVLWAMDAYQLLAGSAINWQRIVQQAQKRAATMALATAGERLKAMFGAPVPDSVLAELRRVRTSRLECLDYRSQDSDNGVIEVARRELFDYLIRTRRWPPFSRLRGWTWYLQVIWGVFDARRLPYEVVKRLFRRGQLSFKHGSVESLARRRRIESAE